MSLHRFSLGPLALTFGVSGASSSSGPSTSVHPVPPFFVRDSSSVCPVPTCLVDPRPLCVRYLLILPALVPGVSLSCRHSSSVHPVSPRRVGPRPLCVQYLLVLSARVRGPSRSVLPLHSSYESTRESFVFGPILHQTWTSRRRRDGRSNRVSDPSWTCTGPSSGVSVSESWSIVPSFEVEGLLTEIVTLLLPLFVSTE